MEKKFWDRNPFFLDLLNWCNERLSRNIVQLIKNGFFNLFLFINHQLRYYIFSQQSTYLIKNFFISKFHKSKINFNLSLSQKKKAKFVGKKSDKINTYPSLEFSGTLARIPRNTSNVPKRFWNRGGGKKKILHILYISSTIFRISRIYGITSVLLSNERRH